MTCLHSYVTDLHIHIGRTRSGAAVKITAAPSLTLENIINYAENIKGIDIIGVIDCHVKETLEEIKEYLADGEAYERRDGGIQFRRVTLFLGTEIEIYDENCHGPIHVLVFMPTIEAMELFSAWMSARMKNPTLSSQRLYENGDILQKKVKELNGLFIPAHIFTPFKSLFGKGVKSSLTEVFDPSMIDAVELGLSSDTSMAQIVTELETYPFLTNSDAHSLEKMGREYQFLRLDEPSFDEFRLALKGIGGREVESNFGLHPLLGKYYQSICANCQSKITKGACEACQSTKVIKGVSERILELPLHTPVRKRPPYIHQIPLEFIPKLGKKTLEKLRSHFQTDMNIIHSATEEELRKVVSPPIVRAILSARKGELSIKTGGGGVYGKIIEKN